MQKNVFSDEKRKEMSDKMHFDLKREDLYGTFSLRSVRTSQMIALSYSNTIMDMWEVVDSISYQTSLQKLILVLFVT